LFNQVRGLAGTVTKKVVFWARSKAAPLQALGLGALSACAKLPARQVSRLFLPELNMSCIKIRAKAGEVLLFSSIPWIDLEELPAILK
jgi:hypothetical protein